MLYRRPSCELYKTFFIVSTAFLTFFFLVLSYSTKDAVGDGNKQPQKVCVKEVFFETEKQKRASLLKKKSPPCLRWQIWGRLTLLLTSSTSLTNTIFHPILAFNLYWHRVSTACILRRKHSQGRTAPLSFDESLPKFCAIPTSWAARNRTWSDGWAHDRYCKGVMKLLNQMRDQKTMEAGGQISAGSVVSLIQRLKLPWATKVTRCKPDSMS